MVTGQIPEDEPERGMAMEGKTFEKRTVLRLLLLNVNISFVVRKQQQQFNLPVYIGLVVVVVIAVTSWES